RDAVERVGGLHAALVVRDDNELRRVRELLEEPREAAHVGLVERRIHLVEEAERRGLVAEDREEERDGGERLLPSREEHMALQAVAGRLDVDLQAAVERVLVLHQPDVAPPTAEEQRERLVEVVADRLEGLDEALARGAVDAADGLLEGLDRVGEV